MLHYDLHDHITLKKGHPCGENHWEIIRKGVDMKLKCMGCGHVIWMKRMEFERRVRKILVKDKWISIVHYQPEKTED